jgi:hypothetical protein
MSEHAPIAEDEAAPIDNNWADGAPNGASDTAVPTPPRPIAFQGDLANLPEALTPLKAMPNWVAWRWIWKVSDKGVGGWTKPPINPHQPNYRAKNNDSKTWGTYEQALAVFQRGECDGIGFAILGTEIAAFDIDDCRDPVAGAIDPAAMKLVDRATSYTECTVSGTGLRIIGNGNGDKIHRKQNIHGTAVEVETYSNAARYIVISGKPLPGTWPHLADISAVAAEVVAELDGAGGDLFRIKQADAKPEPQEKQSEQPQEKGHQRASEDSEMDLPPALRALVCHGPPPGADLSKEFFRAVRWLGSLGWSADKIESYVAGKPITPRRYEQRNCLRQEIDRCLSKPKQDEHAKQDDHQNKAAPEIEIKDGQLSSLATRAEEILINAGVQIFQRGGTLVRPIVETVDASRGRKTKVAQLRVLDVVYLRDLLGRYANWVRYDVRTKLNKPTNPPAETAATVMARVGEWSFRAIAGVISTPTMRPDGSLLTAPGYDKATSLLLVAPPEMPPIPEAPTKDDAIAALKLIEDLLTGFPFVDEVAKAAALSAILTPILRGAFPVTPMHASRAPTAGSGKSFLWDIVAAVATGQLMPVLSTGRDVEELEKRLGAAMLAGQPLISIDNISGELGGDALCQIIERPVVDIRILGRSERVRIEARGTSTFATGNNFLIVGDLTRRVISVSLDPGVERPELRQFDFDPVERVLTNRGAYIAAILTIARAYVVAGRPGKAKRLASFEPWSDLVRSSLIWLGKADVVDSMEAARAEDPERAELSAMLEAWGRVIGVGAGSRVRLNDAILRGMSMVRSDGDVTMEPTHPDLYAALEALAYRASGKRGQRPDSHVLGNYLRRFKGRVVDGRRFAMKPDQKRGAEWWVEEVQTKPVTEDAA